MASLFPGFDVAEFPWGSLAQWTLGHLCLWPGNFRSDAGHIDSPRNSTRLRPKSKIPILLQKYTTQTQIEPNLWNIQQFSALSVALHMYILFTVDPICGGRTVAGRGGFLIAPPGALQLTRDLYKSLPESTNHVDKTRTFFCLVWKILRLCLQLMELYDMPQVAEKIIKLYVQKVVSQVPTRKLSYFGMFLLIAPCFWMHTSSIQIQKAPAAASPVVLASWLNKHSRKKNPAAICLSTIVAHLHIALCSSWSLHGNLPCCRELSITSFKEFPPEFSDLVRMVATSFFMVQWTKIQEAAASRSRSTQKINWPFIFAADLCRKFNNLDRESYFTYEPGKTLK